MKDCLNGKVRSSCLYFWFENLSNFDLCLYQNLTTVLRELGIRTHKVLLDHIRHQVYNTLGGVQLTCDLSAYEKMFQLTAVRFIGGGGEF